MKREKTREIERKNCRKDECRIESSRRRIEETGAVRRQIVRGVVLSTEISIRPIYGGEEMSLKTSRK